ncbi:MAG TPA: hypothetical protein VFP54_04555 [Acidimicrobiales bacterium]|nr:hypothetical protein [Acidimicrobiales bacterium]
MVIAARCEVAADQLLAAMSGARRPGPVHCTTDIPLPPVLGALAAAVDADTPVLCHMTPWSPQAWTDGIARARRSRRLPDTVAETLVHAVDAVDGHCGDEISRADLFQLANGDEVEFFVAVMAWGNAPSGYGWWRTARIAALAGTEEFRAKLAGQMQAARGGAEMAWQAWTSSFKLRQLGPAFATKIAHFAGADPSSGRGPLIADDNVAWSMWAFTGVENIRTDRSAYVRYVDTLTRWANPGGRPDSLERALFLLGPYVRSAWRTRWLTARC